MLRRSDIGVEIGSDGDATDGDVTEIDRGDAAQTDRPGQVRIPGPVIGLAESGQACDHETGGCDIGDQTRVGERVVAGRCAAERQARHGHRLVLADVAVRQLTERPAAHVQRQKIDVQHTAQRRRARDRIGQRAVIDLVRRGEPGDVDSTRRDVAKESQRRQLVIAGFDARERQSRRRHDLACSGVRVGERPCGVARHGDHAGVNRRDTAELRGALNICGRR